MAQFKAVAEVPGLSFGDLLEFAIHPHAKWMEEATGAGHNWTAFKVGNALSFLQFVCLQGKAEAREGLWIAFEAVLEKGFFHTGQVLFAYFHPRGDSVALLDCFQRGLRVRQAAMRARVVQVVLKGCVDVIFGLDDGRTKILVTGDNWKLLLGLWAIQSVALMGKEIWLASLLFEERFELLGEQIEALLHNPPRPDPVRWCPA